MSAKTFLTAVAAGLLVAPGAFGQLKMRPLGTPTPTPPFSQRQISAVAAASRIEAEDATTHYGVVVPLKARLVDQSGQTPRDKQLRLERIGDRPIGKAYRTDVGGVARATDYFSDCSVPQWLPPGRYAVEWSFAGDAQTSPGRGRGYLTIVRSRTSISVRDVIARWDPNVLPYRHRAGEVEVVLHGTLKSLENGRPVPLTLADAVKVAWPQDLAKQPPRLVSLWCAVPGLIQASWKGTTKPCPGPPYDGEYPVRDDECDHRRQVKPAPPEPYIIVLEFVGTEGYFPSSVTVRKP